jgi:hypothetical protein
VKRKKLVVRISGGLGNQLFKLMAGVKLSDNLCKDLAVDVSWFNYFHDIRGRVHQRKLELSHFPNLSNLDYFVSKNLFINERSYQIAKRIPKKLMSQIGYVTEETFLDCQENSKARYMDGRFEDLKFMPNTNRMKELLTFPESRSRWLRDRLEQYGNRFVVLHIRTGDYLNLPKIYGFLTSDYYEKAISLVNQRLGEVPVVLFSENLGVAMEQMKGKVKYHFMQGPEQGISSGEMLQLMSLGVGVISAHSTFSWWAAMLGQIHGTTEVITIPSRFLPSDQGGALRLRPENWLVIDV